jgi:hypothetical protein
VIRSWDRALFYLEGQKTSPDGWESS